MAKIYLLFTFSLIKKIIACSNQGFSSRSGVTVNYDVDDDDFGSDYDQVDYFVDQNTYSVVKPCPKIHRSDIADPPDIISKINNEKLQSYFQKSMNPTKRQSHQLCKEFKKIADTVEITDYLSCKIDPATTTSFNSRGKRSVKKGPFISISDFGDERPSNTLMNDKLNKLFSILKKSTIERLIKTLQPDDFHTYAQLRWFEHEFSVFYRSTLIAVQKEYTDSILPIIGEFKTDDSKCLVESKVWELMCGMLKSDFDDNGVFDGNGTVSNLDFCMF